MIVKTIRVEVKKSKNFQTYMVGEEIQIEDTDNYADIEKLKQECFNRCKKLVIEQLEAEK